MVPAAKPITPRVVLVAATSLWLLCSTIVAHAAPPPPRLVLQLTIDQLRGDLLPRYRARFGAGGFRLLLDRGIYYANAHYEAANTVTCAGHAALVTGADAAGHGIVANIWFDRDAGKRVYCVDDDRYPAVGETAPKGKSPEWLTSTTIGDEIVIASGRKSRAFAISGKDRSAIVPGGHLGKAFWLSGTLDMATSRYYYDELPSWVTAWNERKSFRRYRDSGWTLLHPLDTYLNAASAANPFAHPRGQMTRSFPHTLPQADAELVRALHVTPFLDELTESFAEELMTQEKVGQNGVTDYLSIAFSATDYVGHSYGPDSVESEDNLLHLDVTLARLFKFVDETVGLRNTVIVLSADHGVEDVPEERSQDGYDAGRVGGRPLREQLNDALKRRMSTPDDLVLALVSPNVYLDRQKMAEDHLEPTTVEAALAEIARATPGIAYAFTRSDLLAGRVGESPLIARVQRSFVPAHSGDVILIAKPLWQLSDPPNADAATHGSPYSYDTYVPIVFLAPTTKPATVYESVAPEQVAPTLALLLGTKPPSGCICDPPLPHALNQQ